MGGVRPRARAQAVYTALKETEARATDLLPLWKLGPLATALVPRQVRARRCRVSFQGFPGGVHRWGVGTVPHALLFAETPGAARVALQPWLTGPLSMAVLCRARMVGIIIVS